MSGVTGGRVDTEGLLACPVCDTLYRRHTPAAGELSVCGHCHTVLAAPRRKAGMLILSLAVAALVLLAAATVLPFLALSARGLSTDASLLDVALAFSTGGMGVLVVATLAMILALPAARMALLIYVLTPVVFDRPPWPGARAAFRHADTLRPWAMAEVFAIGCAVSLVKITDLAQVDFGPAFWMFACLVLLVVAQDRTLCRASVWDALAAAPPK